MSVTIKEKSKKDYFGTAKIRFQRFFIHKNKVDEKVGQISNLVQSPETYCESCHEKQAWFQKFSFRPVMVGSVILTSNLKSKKSGRKRRWFHSIWRLSHTAELAEAKPGSSGMIFHRGFFLLIVIKHLFFDITWYKLWERHLVSTFLKALIKNFQKQRRNVRLRPLNRQHDKPEKKFLARMAMGGVIFLLVIFCFVQLIKISPENGSTLSTISTGFTKTGIYPNRFF